MIRAKPALCGRRGGGNRSPARSVRSRFVGSVWSLVASRTCAFVRLQRQCNCNFRRNSEQPRGKKKSSNKNSSSRAYGAVRCTRASVNDGADKPRQLSPGSASARRHGQKGCQEEDPLENPQHWQWVPPLPLWEFQFNPTRNSHLPSLSHCYVTGRDRHRSDRFDFCYCCSDFAIGQEPTLPTQLDDNNFVIRPPRANGLQPRFITHPK